MELETKIILSVELVGYTKHLDGYLVNNVVAECAHDMLSGITEGEDIGAHIHDYLEDEYGFDGEVNVTLDTVKC